MAYLKIKKFLKKLMGIKLFSKILILVLKRVSL